MSNNKIEIIKEKDIESLSIDRIDKDIVCFLPENFEIICSEKDLEYIESLFQKYKDLNAVICDIEIYESNQDLSYIEYKYNKIEYPCPVFVNKSKIKSAKDLYLKQIMANSGLIVNLPEPFFKLISLYVN